MSALLEAFLAHALRWPSLTVRERRPLEHQSNRLYDAWRGDQHLIVKEYLNPDEHAEAPVREYGALERLAALDIAPQPVLYAPQHALDGIGPLVVYEYMAGEMWDRGVRTHDDLAALADGWRRTNAVETKDMWGSRGMERSLEVIAGLMSDSFLLYSKWAANSFPSGQRAAESCLTLLELRHSVIRTLTTCRTVLCFCRADPRFANVIGRPDGRVGFVDWEDCGLRDPARDLADVVTHANQEDLIAPAMWTTFLEPYLSGRAELDPELRDRMHLYLALFPLFWLSLTMRAGVSRAERGQLASWSINGRPPNWRLRRYLARATAWPSVNFAQELGKAQAISFFPGTG